METKTHWKKAFNKDYLGSWDLEEGKDLKATIDYVEVRELINTNGVTEKRNVAIFKEKIKPMILNVDSCKKLKKFTKSSYIEDWKNTTVQIYVKENIKAFGELTDGLRLRDKQPSIKKPELIPGTDVWENAVNYLKEGNLIDKIEQKYIISDQNRSQLLSEAI